MQGRIGKNDIDARMLKALADLPVDLGIEAVDKFAMASLDSVRSKTGFMVSRCLCYFGWCAYGLLPSSAVLVLTSSMDAACRWGSSSAFRRTSLHATADATLMTGTQCSSTFIWYWHPCMPSTLLNMPITAEDVVPVWQAGAMGEGDAMIGMTGTFHWMLWAADAPGVP